MKFTVTFKDPDGVSDSITRATRDSLLSIGDLNDDERDVVAERRRERIESFLSKWIEYGEYIRIEFDTEEGTATIKEIK